MKNYKCESCSSEVGINDNFCVGCGNQLMDVLTGQDKKDMDKVVTAIKQFMKK